MKDDPRIHYINQGLWEKECLLKFQTGSFQGNGNGAVKETGTGQIVVNSVDEIVQEKVTFLKLDVEGSELQALKGAEKTIRKNRPKLAVCVYHKLEDLRILYEYINCLGNYQFYLRAEWDNVDTELYYLCIPEN